MPYFLQFSSINRNLSLSSSAIHFQSRVAENLRTAFSSPIESNNSNISRKSKNLKIVNFNLLQGAKLTILMSTTKKLNAQEYLISFEGEALIMIQIQSNVIYIPIGNS
jgi:hypothetical protein